MSEKLGVEEPEKVWRPLFQKYNQSAKGLRWGKSCDCKQRVERLTPFPFWHDTQTCFVSLRVPYFPLHQ